VQVLHVITGLHQGGAEGMLEKLVLTGQRLNPEIPQAVISLGPPAVVADRLSCAGIPVQSLGLRVSPRAASQMFSLLRRLRAGRADTVVQTWLWHADLLGGLCARAAGNHRVVWNLRNSMPQHPSTKPTSRAVARLCARLSRWLPLKIVCNSQAALAAHVALGYRQDKCVVIPNGFDLRLFRPEPATRSPVRERWGVAPDALLVGMVARVDPLKDHATFIGAASQVASAIPAVRFVLVGDRVTSDEGIRKLLERSGISNRFVLQDRSDDIPSVMRALDVFCLASKSEGFPNVLGEAMACGIPAVSSDAGAARELLGDERLVAPVGDAHALAGCLLRLLRLTPEERHAQGVALRSALAAHFDIERVWESYRRLWCSL
jgi:glycosyltransferase involved in cell wall biosynthesis